MLRLWRSRSDIDDATTNGKRLVMMGSMGGLSGTADAAVSNTAQLVRDV